MNQYERENVGRIFKDIRELEKTKKMSKERKAYYLYRELGDIYQYKVSYNYLDETNIEEYIAKIELYEEGTTEDGKALCLDMNGTYVEALKLLGIEAKLVFLDEANPLSHNIVIFKGNNGNNYFADLTPDVMHIKTGMKIRNFGLAEDEALDKLFKMESRAKTEYIFKLHNETEGRQTEIPEEQLKQWDDEDGYTYKGCYTNDILDMLASEMVDEEFICGFFGTNKKDELVQKKIEFIMDKLEIVNVHKKKKIGDVEAVEYYTKVLRKILTQEEWKKYVEFYCGYVEEDTERNSRIVIIIKKENENIYYLYNNQSQIFEQIEKEKFIKEPIYYNGENKDGRSIRINNVQLVNYYESRLQGKEAR